MHTMHLCRHTMHRPVVAACGVKQQILRGRVRVTVTADMKKEKKKLAKQQMKLEEQLCSFKKKLEQLTAGDCDAGIISSVPVTSALISQLLTQLQSHPMLEEESSSSSSSDSSEDDEPREMKRGMTEKRDMKQDMKQDRKSQQLQQLVSDAALTTPPTQSPPSPATATAAAGSSSPTFAVTQSPAQSSSFSALLQQQRLEDSFDLTSVGVLGDIGVSQPRVSSAYLAPQPMMTAASARILVCTGSKCANRGADDVLEAVSDARDAAGSTAEIVPCKCLGKCKMGPAMRVKPSDGTRSILYTGVTPESATGLVSAYLHPAASDPPSSSPDIIELPIAWDRETLQAPFC